MKLDEIERALREDRAITPSSDFSQRVMRAVRSQAEEREGIGFPWLRLASGLATCAGLTVVGLVIMPAGSGPPSIDAETLISTVERSAWAPAVAWTSTALLGSYLLTWGSLRLTGVK